LLKFIITKSDLQFRLDSELSKIVNITGVYKLEYSSTDENNIKFEEKLSTKNPTYLFHGSKLNNWFSIIYNGLQIYSGTSKQENGAAYGNGIYLSDSIQLSKSYCKSNTNFVIGVFEVVNAEKYKKLTNIYVVNKIEDIRLKYIVDVDKISQDKLNELGLYITKSKKQTHTNLKNYVGVMKNKRLMVEYNKIKKMEQSLEDNDESSSKEFKLLESDNMNLWNVKLLQIDNESNLYKDMQTLSIDHILLEIEFTERYPIEPPMVRVLKPSFVPITGHVTDGGSICYELLTNQGWSPAISMESLLISLKAIISDDGRLNGLENSRYTKRNAISGYNRVLQAHGWK
jgi:ubiquitin-protein ligase